jgi:hypothetical protein
MTPATPAQRGYQPLYTSGTRCPGCGRGHWLVGRVSAECGFCATALPLAPERAAA